MRVVTQCHSNDSVNKSIEDVLEKSSGGQIYPIYTFQVISNEIYNTQKFYT